MSRKNIFIAIILVSFAISFGIGIMIMSDLSEDVITLNIQSERESLAFLLFIQYVFSLPFFIIVMKYFNNDKNLNNFALWSVIGRFLYMINLVLLLLHIVGIFNLLLFMLSIAMVIGAGFAAIKMVRSEMYDKGISYSILFIAVMFLIFESGMAVFFTGMVSSTMRVVSTIIIVIIEVVAVIYFSDYFSASKKIKIEKGEKVKKNAYERTTI